jgi:hypothetical protein
VNKKTFRFTNKEKKYTKNCLHNRNVRFCVYAQKSVPREVGTGGMCAFAHWKRERGMRAFTSTLSPHARHAGQPRLSASRQGEPGVGWGGGNGDAAGP